NRAIESWIRECPEQYYWVHRRFRYRPEEYGDAYAR
ncbi:MAG: acyltransferase, partial [Gammaproteobacteria bacterium]